MKKVISGSIFRIPLPKNRGFAYGKYVHLNEITGNTYDSHIFKVYDFISQDPINDIDLIVKNDLLYSPFLLAGKPRIRGLGWKIIGNEIGVKDKFFPDFKQLRGNRWIAVKPYEEGIKSAINDIDFKRIEHLETSTLRCGPEIPIRILMELFRREGKDIEKEFDFEGEDKEILDIIYERIKVTPIYSKIPEKYRGRVLPEGVSLDIN